MQSRSHSSASGTRTAISCEWKEPGFIHPRDQRTASDSSGLQNNLSCVAHCICVFLFVFRTGHFWKLKRASFWFKGFNTLWRFVHMKCQHTLCAGRTEVWLLMDSNQDKMTDIGGCLTLKKVLYFHWTPVRCSHLDSDLTSIKCDWLIMFMLQTTGQNVERLWALSLHLLIKTVVAHFCTILKINQTTLNAGAAQGWIKIKFNPRLRWSVLSQGMFLGSREQGATTRLLQGTFASFWCLCSGSERRWGPRSTTSSPAASACCASLLR